MSCITSTQVTLITSNVVTQTVVVLPASSSVGTTTILTSVCPTSAPNATTTASCVTQTTTSVFTQSVPGSTSTRIVTSPTVITSQIGVFTSCLPTSTLSTPESTTSTTPASFLTVTSQGSAASAVPTSSISPPSQTTSEAVVVGKSVVSSIGNGASTLTYYSTVLVTGSAGPTLSTATAVQTLQPSASDESSPPTTSTGSIVGGVIGGILGLVALLALIWFIMRRRSRERAEINEEIWQPDRFHPARGSSGGSGGPLRGMTPVSDLGHDSLEEKRGEDVVHYRNDSNRSEDMRAVRSSYYSSHGSGSHGHSDLQQQQYGAMNLSPSSSINGLQSYVDPRGRVMSPVAYYPQYRGEEENEERLSGSSHSHPGSDTAATTGSTSYHHSSRPHPQLPPLDSLPESPSLQSSLGSSTAPFHRSTPSPTSSFHELFDNNLLPPPSIHPQIERRESARELNQFLGARVVNAED